MNRRELVQELNRLAEPAYRDFSASLIPGVKGILGVRLPALRDIARRLVRENGTGFRQILRPGAFEEDMIHGMALGCLRIPFGELLPMVDGFIPIVTNWSVCDSSACGLKSFRKAPAPAMEFLAGCLESPSEFRARFGAVMLLDHFVDDGHVDQVLDLLKTATCPGFYCRMAVAWAYSVACVKYPKRTIQAMRASDLPRQTLEMAVRKVAESRRATPDVVAAARKLL